MKNLYKIVITINFPKLSDRFVKKFYKNLLKFINELFCSYRAIHVGNLTYNDGVIVEKHLINDVMQSVKPWIETIIDKNYK